MFERRLRRKHQGFGDTFYIDEVVVMIQGKQQYLWRAVDKAQKFLDVIASVYNFFNLGRHLVSEKNYKLFRLRAFVSWQKTAEK